MPKVSFELARAICAATLNNRLRQTIEMLDVDIRNLVLECAEQIALGHMRVSPISELRAGDGLVVTWMATANELARIYTTTHYPLPWVMDDLMQAHYGYHINSIYKHLHSDNEVEFSLRVHQACVSGCTPLTIFITGDDNVPGGSSRSGMNLNTGNLVTAIRQADIVLPTIAEALA